MSILLTHPTAGAGGAPVTLSLPPDLIWSDEFAWQQVEQATQYTTTGAIVLDAWARLAGRPITLRGDVDYAWCQRSTLTTLNTWAGLAGQQFTLLLHGQTRTVVMDHASGAIAAEAVVPYSDPLPEDHYTLTLRFLEL